jgi:hypothetical protein
MAHAWLDSRVARPNMITLIGLFIMVLGYAVIAYYMPFVQVSSIG